MVFICSPHRRIPALAVLFLFLTVSSGAQPPPPQETGASDSWTDIKQIQFSRGDRTGMLLAPRTAAKGRPWLWSAAPPTHDGIHKALLDRGFHVAWIDVNDLYGNAEALSHWDVFYEWAVNEQQLSGKPALLGTEEDALALFSWAARHPDAAGCLYAQDPWLDLQPVPDPASPVLEKVRHAHGCVSGTEATSLPDAPLNKATEFGKAAIPMLFLHLGEEAASPVRKQAEQFYKAYRLAGQGSFETITAADNPRLEDGLTLHAVHFILKNTGQLPTAKPGEPLPQMTEWAMADFSGSAGIHVLNDILIIETGNDMSGVLWQGDVPKMDYEITLDAMRLSGNDFFCGLTAPWGESSFSLIVGGWGGTCIGISSLDWLDAYNNETARFRSLESHRWYPVKLRATGGRIQAWVDKEQLVDVEVGDRDVDIRWEMAPVQPLGIATWRTTGAFRKFRLTPLSPQKLLPE